MGELTEAQKRALDEDGYFVVADVFSPADVAEMRAEFDRLRDIEDEFGGDPRDFSTALPIRRPLSCPSRLVSSRPGDASSVLA